MRNDAAEDDMLMAERGQAAPATPAVPPVFEEMYSAYRTPLYNYIYRLVGDREQAADLLQETFVKVYRALDDLPDGAGRTPWLYRIATNTCYDVLRRRRLIQWLPWTRDYTAESGRREESPGERYAMAEGVHDALHAVPLSLRAPLLLHAVHGFCYADIAVALGTSEAAVKMRVSRARAAFRAAYTVADGEEER